MYAWASYRTLLANALFSALVLGAGVPGTEPYLVLSRHAELYDGANRMPLRLLPGDVLPAQPDDLHRGWLNVTLNQKSLQAKAENFGRRHDLEAGYAKRLADLDSQIAASTRQIALLAETSERLYAAAQAVRFDATVQYRFRQAVPLDAANAGPERARRAAPPWGQGVRYVDSYEDKISPARARTLAARWTRERGEAERESERRRDERRDCLRERLTVEAQRAHVAGRFAAFDAGAGLLRGEPYVTVQDRTQLYAGTRLAEELAVGVVVTAVPNRDDGEWLKVWWQGRLLDGRTGSFLNRLAVEDQLGRRAAWLEQALQDKEEHADALARRRQQLDAIGLAADYAAQLDYIELRTYPFAPDYDGGRYYLPPPCPSRAVEVVHRSRARSLVRACDKEIDAIDDELRRAEKALRDWRRELATIRPRLADLRRRLDGLP